MSVGTWERFIENLAGRLDGPMHFRFIVQPLMATIFAVIGGVKDAKAGKPAYFWDLFLAAGHRKELIKDGWKHVGKICLLAVILDVIYQLKFQGTLYPGESLIVALVLAIVPYVALRGPVNRVVRLWEKK